MTPNDPDADRTPSPERLASWVDGELSCPEAAALEAWLLRHPEAARDAEALHQITRLFRDHPPPSPCPARWRDTLDRVGSRLRPAAGRPWRLRLLAALTLAAASIGAVAVARSLWPTPAPPEQPIARAVEEEEDAGPFPVALVSEVTIIQMDAADADRIAAGQPLMGTFEFVSGDDVDLVQAEPGPEDGRLPRLERRAGLPMIVAWAEEGP